MTILVTGATGTVGRHLVTTLLARGTAVRALTRKPEDANLPAGVEVVAGDLADASTLGSPVFDDVDRAFVFPAEGVDAFVDAAIAHGVHRFTVLSSLAAAKEFPRDHGSASQLHHTAVEAAVTGRTDAWTILRPGTFATNLLSWAWQIRSGAPIRAPYLASAQAPIHEYDVAEAAAQTLLSDNHLGEAIPLTGPQALTRAEQVAAIGEALGREIPLVEITPEEFRAETARFIPEPVMNMLLAYWHDTLTVPDVPRPVTPVTGRPGRTLAEWAADHRPDFETA
ncbi:NAD(P)H-binding protein [Bailinhaonella thermotolerans]|uniref:NAD-dependent epimerase/dehydratase family protein n=1 Tax=Bailinhaonella thermotolerans TaxID=1070861 RepID=A0A3A4B5B2_9ACTN|nr:NAD(P)H-binding protein [Bailinhaonella thermotolerans]RJL35810.1 NAD-dependent epimerase/dehydratase family protein [Bailinhaonella thermotolerans]